MLKKYLEKLKALGFESATKWLIAAVLLTVLCMAMGRTGNEFLLRLSISIESFFMGMLWWDLTKPRDGD